MAAVLAPGGQLAEVHHDPVAGRDRDLALGRGAGLGDGRDRDLARVVGAVERGDRGGAAVDGRATGAEPARRQQLAVVEGRACSGTGRSRRTIERATASGSSRSATTTAPTRAAPRRTNGRRRAITVTAPRVRAPVLPGVGRVSGQVDHGDGRAGGDAAPRHPTAERRRPWRQVRMSTSASTHSRIWTATRTIARRRRPVAERSRAGGREIPGRRPAERGPPGQRLAVDGELPARVDGLGEEHDLAVDGTFARGRQRAGQRRRGAGEVGVDQRLGPGLPAGLRRRRRRRRPGPGSRPCSRRRRAIRRPAPPGAGRAGGRGCRGSPGGSCPRGRPTGPRPRRRSASTGMSTNRIPIGASSRPSRSVAAPAARPRSSATSSSARVGSCRHRSRRVAASSSASA